MACLHGPLHYHQERALAKRLAAIAPSPGPELFPNAIPMLCLRTKQRAWTHPRKRGIGAGRLRRRGPASRRIQNE